MHQEKKRELVVDLGWLSGLAFFFTLEKRNRRQGGQSEQYAPAATPTVTATECVQMGH